MTAEEFLISKSLSKDKEIVLNSTNNGEYTISMMIEFAKLKVQEALNATQEVEILDDIDYETGQKYYYQNYQGLLDCYPLENIK